MNNAGITKDTLLMRMTEEDFNRVIEVNLNSVFNMTKAVQRTFLKQRSGSIVNISSVVGVKGMLVRPIIPLLRLVLLASRSQHLS